MPSLRGGSLRVTAAHLQVLVPLALLAYCARVAQGAQSRGSRGGGEEGKGFIDEPDESALWRGSGPRIRRNGNAPRVGSRVRGEMIRRRGGYTYDFREAWADDGWSLGGRGRHGRLRPGMGAMRAMGMDPDWEEQQKKLIARVPTPRCRASSSEASTCAREPGVGADLSGCKEVSSPSSSSSSSSCGPAVVEGGAVRFKERGKASALARGPRQAFWLTVKQAGDRLSAVVFAALLAEHAGIPLDLTSTDKISLRHGALPGLGMLRPRLSAGGRPQQYPPEECEATMQACMHPHTVHSACFFAARDLLERVRVMTAPLVTRALGEAQEYLRTSGTLARLSPRRGGAGARVGRHLSLASVGAAVLLMDQPAGGGGRDFADFLPLEGHLGVVCPVRGLDPQPHFTADFYESILGALRRPVAAPVLILASDPRDDDVVALKSRLERAHHRVVVKQTSPKMEVDFGLMLMASRLIVNHSPLQWWAAVLGSAQQVLHYPHTDLMKSLELTSDMVPGEVERLKAAPLY